MASQSFFLRDWYIYIQVSGVVKRPPELPRCLLACWIFRCRWCIFRGWFPCLNRRNRQSLLSMRWGCRESVSIPFSPRLHPSPRRAGLRLFHNRWFFWQAKGCCTVSERWWLLRFVRRSRATGTCPARDIAWFLYGSYEKLLIRSFMTSISLCKVLLEDGL